ncbi:MAG: class I SAM-dependent methyltransferase [Anaerolineae bacterium]|jgi:ubiquinone/menaquinone biosynthesis C-methylase UbiE
MTRNDDVTEVFAELASDYEATMDRELGSLWGLKYHEFVSGLMATGAVQQGDAVLDVATGTALIPRMFQREVGPRGRLVGLDITPGMLHQARDRALSAPSFASIHLVCASAMSIPFAEGSFDAAICGFGTHHMDVSQLLSELKRVLKAGGRLLLADAVAPDYWRRAGMDSLIRNLALLGQRVLDGTRGHLELEAIWNLRTIGEWYKALSALGFIEITLTQHRARRPWYPAAVLFQAAVSGS